MSPALDMGDALKPRYSTIDTIVRGLVDGFKMCVDPIGAGYSAVSGKKTFGGNGYRGTTFKDYSNPRVDYDSLVYKALTYGGAIAGGIALLGGRIVPQLVAGVYDLFKHRKLRREGKEMYR
ncbi:hypothetical protein JXB02_04645 [Candidatus Woesearchaeota archaeon]|nr:hypothetical protein [Candidatus Woesearchaeota archaeon]